MTRTGISRVAIEVIILVIGVALALLIFSPIGSYIFGALGRTGVVGGQTTVDILSASVQTTTTMEVYIKNLGPNDVELESTAPESWQVFIDTNSSTTLTYNAASTGEDDGIFEVNEVIILDAAGFTALSDTASYTIIVYGPGGTRTEYLFRGG